MADVKLGDLYLSKEESKDIIEFLAKKRNIKNYKSKSSDSLYKIFKKQSKNKKRIDDIRDELKDPTYNISKSESKEIKKNLYNIEKRKKISSRKTQVQDLLLPPYLSLKYLYNILSFFKSHLEKTN